jgi:hypothetical protein
VRRIAIRTVVRRNEIDDSRIEVIFPGPITGRSIGTRITDQIDLLLATLYERSSSERPPGSATIGASPATSTATRDPPRRSVSSASCSDA